MKIVRAKPGDYISLGHQGEEYARHVEFDVSGFVRCYGEGSVELVIQRTGDKEYYPAEITQDGDKAVWIVSPADTAVPSQWNKYELRYYAGETLAKSAVGNFGVAAGLVGDATEPPDPYKSWVDQVLEAGASVKDATVNPPIIGENGNWWIWDFDAKQYVDTGTPTGGSAIISDAEIADLATTLQ